MKIIHKTKEYSIEKEIPDSKSSGFLLANKTGTFYAHGIPSRYRGFYTTISGDLLKIMDSVEINDFEAQELTHEGWQCTLGMKDGKESVSHFIPLNANALVIESTTPITGRILLDVKKPYDNRTWGRSYSITSQGKDHALVEFTKRTDAREDSDDGREEYRVNIAIYAPGGDLTITNEWLRMQYAMDEERRSPPGTRYVHAPCSFAAKTIIIIAGNDSDLPAQARAVAETLQTTKKLQKEYAAAGYLNQKKHLPSQGRVAELCALHALDQLTWGIEDPHIIAGLPWFFQTWSRDELISTGALILAKEYSIVKKILLRHLSNIQEDGTIPNRFPVTTTASADAIGWLCVRLDDFLSALRKDGLLEKTFSKAELDTITSLLAASVQGLITHHTKDGWAMAEPQSTWMDTMHDGDGRAGARIEIQTLRLRMYRLLHNLTQDDIYQKMEESLAKQTKRYFWNGSILADGLSDFTIRPNVFIAAYTYPELLTEEEWATCFENTMHHLWLEWGGIASIDTEHSLMTWQCTGEDSKSYHRGDSWYFINNMAGIVLQRTNKKLFSDMAQKILAASAREILHKGFIGCHAEVSSAGELRSEGCWSQAWSNALFVELYEAMNN